MKNKKIKKILTIFIILILLVSTSAFLYASSVIDDPIELSFQDKNLYNAMKLHLQTENMKYNLDESTLTITVSKEELNQVEQLNLQGTDGAKISNITGLESFVNLRTINLSNNSIIDITPISSLSNITSINLSNNINVNLENLPNKANLEELNIASTKNSDISFISNLPKIKTLNVSNNGISVLTPLKTLRNLQILDVSENTAITIIDDILTLANLKELNMATTGITDLLHSDYIEDEYENGIYLLTKLESLNVENNDISIEPLLRTYWEEKTQTGETEEKVYLSNLKKLNFNYTKQNYVDFYSLSKLQTLTHLYMKGNEIYSIDDYIATLPNLQYIDLSENNIDDISGFVKYGYDDNGNEIIEDTLSAEEIILTDNYIQKITPLAKLGHPISYLDLSYNLIFYTNEIEYSMFPTGQNLNLRNQGRNKFDDNGEQEYYAMDIKQKAAKINQYIILPTLFQNSKDSRSKLYAEDTTFSYENIKLNTEAKYQTPGNYNIIIEPPVENEENYEEIEPKRLSITLHGGIADNSILYFEVIDDLSAVDSLIFKDSNLATAIESDLRSRIPADYADQYYVAKAEDILNITNSLIYETETLHLEEKKISNLSGLESFENLKKLYLSNNNLSSIDELKYCGYMEELYVPNNPNIGNNNSAIENMTYLTKLDLSTTGMTNIENLKNLITKWQKDDYYTLTYLNISNNEIGNIEKIGMINSLEELHISNIGIANLEEVEILTNLKTLNASGNKIEEITPLKGLSKLKFLTISGNKIKDITPISKIALDTLDFSNNKVKDVSSLTRTYTTIKMDTNQISDISNFEGKLITTFSVTNQKISQTIDNAENQEIIIALPEILKDSRDSSSKVYSANNLVTTNCELTTDGNSVIVNPVELGDNIATVKINGGNAHLTTFAIAAPLKGTITYNPSNETKTNQDITATIAFNRSNVTITNNEGNNAYTFTENGKFTFEYEDENGFSGTETAIVNNIDKIAPQSTEIKQEIVDKKVVVTIKVNEQIIEPEGWRLQLTSDKISITKTFTLDENETVNLVDEAGNATAVNVVVKIDRNAPRIIGVENGEKYNNSVTPVIEDENLDSVILTKDSVPVTNYKAGAEIKDAGKYELTATDKFGNVTKISFEIEMSDIITSTVLFVDETTLIIRDINPKTTVQELINKVQSDMAYEIINTKGLVVSNTDKVGTGYKIKMTNDKMYTLIVRGDINGDGEIGLGDLARISRIFVSSNANPSQLEVLAIDVSKNGKIELNDITVISRLKIEG